MVVKDEGIVRPHGGGGMVGTKGVEPQLYSNAHQPHPLDQFIKLSVYVGFGTKTYK